MKKLTESELQKALENLPGWNYTEGAIEKKYTFADFNEAFAFLARTALLSEKMNHHAEYAGVYNQLTLRLSTHDADGITQKDLDFAKAAETYLPRG